MEQISTTTANNFRKVSAFIVPKGAKFPHFQNVTTPDGETHAVPERLISRSLLIVHKGKEYAYNVKCGTSCKNVRAYDIVRMLLRATCETERVTLMQNEDMDMKVANRKERNAMHTALRGHYVYVVDNKGRVLADEGYLDISHSCKVDGTAHTLKSVLALKSTDTLYRMVVGTYEGRGEDRTFVPANGKWDDEKVVAVLRSTVACVLKSLTFVNKFQKALERAAKANDAEELAEAKKLAEQEARKRDLAEKKRANTNATSESAESKIEITAETEA